MGSPFISPTNLTGTSHPSNLNRALKSWSDTFEHNKSNEVIILRVAAQNKDIKVLKKYEILSTL